MFLITKTTVNILSPFEVSGNAPYDQSIPFLVLEPKMHTHYIAYYLGRKKDNPKDRTNTADVIVGHVLSTAWPCEPSSRRQSSGGRST